MTDELKRESERLSSNSEALLGVYDAMIHLHSYTDICNHIRDQRAHIAKLQAALDEARKDAERIDWLAAKAKTCTVRMNGQHPWSLRGPALQGPSFRHAIDAAMERKP